MLRFARAGFLVLVLLLLGAGTWWLLLSDASPPRSPSIAGLQDSVSLRWSDDGLAAIDAAGEIDALTALGYAHGLKRGWTVTLWRQTALGQLGRWFGTGVLPIDRHTRRLGLAHHAQTAYDQLSPPTRRRLKAYARGLNAALQSTHVREQDAFVLLEVKPAPWQPWHTLAIERLLAWLATSPLDPPDDAPAGVTDFRQNDQLLRRWLHLHGWNRSVTWAVRSDSATDSPKTKLFQRHVLGATASPVVQEVRVDRPGAPRLMGATVPGLPLLPTGSSGDQAWASLLRSTARLEQVPVDPARVRQRHDRLTPSGGDEQLVRIRRVDGGLVLNEPAQKNGPDPRTVRSDARAHRPRRDTAWVLRWPGLTEATDLPAWLRRAGLSPSGDTTSFGLFAADGLRVTSGGQWTVLGTPSVVVRDSARRIFVGNARWARHQAESLRSHHRQGPPLDVQGWSASDSSTWAAHLFSRVAPTVDRLTATHPSLENVATYLRNWDETYDPSSIGATIFDRWMDAYRADLGRLPQPRDTAAYFSTYRRHRALLRALDSLHTQLGPDPRQWRWERAVPDRRFFPVWSADSLVNDDLRELSTTQYAPLDRRGRGHPSALAGGPSLVDPASTAPSPTVWEGWTAPASSSFTVRRHHYDPAATFARSRMNRSRPSPCRLARDSLVHTTTLVPAPE